MEERIAIPAERLSLLESELPKLSGMLGVEILLNQRVKLSGEALRVYRAKQVIQAFGRGFSLEDACLLLQENYALAILDVSAWGKSRARQQVLKGRVIGRKGRARQIIEQCTGAKIAVYGKTVSILGPWQAVELAKRAVEMLLEGKSHGVVFKFLERYRL